MQMLHIDLLLSTKQFRLCGFTPSPDGMGTACIFARNRPETGLADDPSEKRNNSKLLIGQITPPTDSA